MAILSTRLPWVRTSAQIHGTGVKRQLYLHLIFYLGAGKCRGQVGMQLIEEREIFGQFVQLRIAPERGPSQAFSGNTVSMYKLLTLV